MPGLNLSDPVIAQAYKEMLSAQYGGDSQQVEDLYNQAVAQSGGVNGLQTGVGQVNQQYNQATMNLQDRLSAMGLGSSGVGLGLLSQLQGQRSTSIDQAVTSADQQQLGALQSLLGGYNSASDRNLQQQQMQAQMWEKGAVALGSLAAAPFTGGASLAGLTSLLGGGGSGIQSNAEDPSGLAGSANFFGTPSTGGTQFQLPKFK